MPEDGVAYRGMGIAYTLKGDPEKAVQNYEKYIELSPDAADAPQLKQMIEGYRSQQ